METQTTLIPAWVDGTLTPVEKLEVHQRGLRHRAVSVFLLSDQGVLLQQRALDKYHTPGLWANTCCTHPYWDEAPSACAPRRLEQELGIVGVPLSHAGQVEYRADVGGGMIEHEVVDLFVGHVSSDLTVQPNPAEVAQVDWVTAEALNAQLTQTPARFTPWLRIYMAEHSRLIFG